MPMEDCSVEWCRNPTRASGYCSKHYEQVRREGSVFVPIIKKCPVENCTTMIHLQNRHHKGYCRFHWQRLYHGSPKIDAPRNPCWGNGKSDYPRHSLFKKRRTLKLIQNNYRCSECNAAYPGAKSNYLRAHHINHDKSDHRLSNLAILCHVCHVRKHTMESYAKKQRIEFGFKRFHIKAVTV